DGTGSYSISSLLSGTYTITVSLAGYVTGTITGVTVAATGLDVTNQNLTLQRLYTVTYDPNGGGGTAPVSQSVVAGQITLPTGTGMTAPVGSGRTFGGWTAGSTTYAAGASYTVSADVTFKAIWAGVTSVGAIGNHISQSGAAGTESNPVPLPVEVTFNNMDDWRDLLLAIRNAGKYVSLDLTGSTMAGIVNDGEFTPGNYNTGEPFIVALTLPADVTKLQSGSPGYSTFRNFTKLQEISGPKVEIVGAELFYNKGPKLRSVSFPVATTALNSIFGYCKVLTAVDLGKVISLGNMAFDKCEALSSLDLSAAKTIGNHVFSGCIALSSLDLRAATSLGDGVFEGTGSATLTIILGATPPTVGTDMFNYVTTARTVILKVPSGATGNYTEAWKNAFKGQGTSGSDTTKINNNINLTITTY
ncbi:MAG: leucine-rich repeat protein, partial [Treponema sp.]|nr:leucine-rich repeat protein [Treponema sp.]